MKVIELEQGEDGVYRPVEPKLIVTRKDMPVTSFIAKHGDKSIEFLEGFTIGINALLKLQKLMGKLK
jgi:hypothetical protein